MNLFHRAPQLEVSRREKKRRERERKRRGGKVVRDREVKAGKVPSLSKLLTELANFSPLSRSLVYF